MSEERIHQMFKEAVDIEIEFVTESLPVRLIGMNQDLMSEYIKFVADTLLIQLNYKTIYNVNNPFGFMENLGLSEISNFFEKRVTSYSSSKVGKNTNVELTFDDDDF